MRPDTINILLVEDNPGDVILISEALAIGAIPKNIEVAPDGEFALRFLLREGRFQDAPVPDLIILDLNLPKLDGREVLEFIKQDSTLRHIPVVIFSSSTADRDVRSAYEHHANCYLSKPSSLDGFLDVVQQIEQYWLHCVALPVL